MLFGGKMEITNVGFDYKHPVDFKIQRPYGSGDYILLIVRSPAFFVFDGVPQYTNGNAVIIFKKGTPQIYGAYNEEYVNDWIHFDASFEDVLMIEKLNIPLDKLMEFQSVTAMSEFIKYMFFEKYSGNKNSVDSADMYFRLLLFKISDLLEQRVNNSSELSEHLNTLRNNIYSDPKKKWRIDEIANDLLISKSYLQHQYKILFKTNIKNDIKKSRIEYSQYLLFSTDYTISAISDMCGYQNDVHFMRIFKDEVGCTPTEYRMNSNFSKKKTQAAKKSAPFSL